MSDWTHVNAIMRVDENTRDERSNSEIIEENLRRIPEGCEGPLRYSIADEKNSNQSTVLDCVISIFGDLRDFNDSEYIKNWFLKFCKSLCIRSAIIEIHIDGGSFELLRYNWEKRILV